MCVQLVFSFAMFISPEKTYIDDIFISKLKYSLRSKNSKGQNFMKFIQDIEREFPRTVDGICGIFVAPPNQNKNFYLRIKVNKALTCSMENYSLANSLVYIVGNSFKREERTYPP